MSETAAVAREAPRLFLRQDSEQVAVECLPALEVAIYSQRCPGKESANEDGAAIIPLADDSVVVAIADGVGGARGGELASGAALEALALRVQRDVAAQEPLRAAILDGIEAANAAVCGLNMGAATTMAVVEFRQGAVRPYHVGDSKILVTGQRGRIRYQTVSHAPVAYAVEAGFLAEHKAIFHEDNHLVSNVVGDPHMRIEIGPTLQLAARDTVLVASDGLFDNLWIDEIVAVIRKGGLGPAVQQLAELARGRMLTQDDKPTKPDDLTIVAFRKRAQAKRGAAAVPR